MKIKIPLKLHVKKNLGVKVIISFKKCILVSNCELFFHSFWRAWYNEHLKLFDLIVNLILVMY